ncbi:unnamed protein product [Paramecium pentaurelia]|uniref:Uncharacterized protein n=1 Tax=Paramecium pentaurelia TaxID=43138 RepID=A0A8S1X9Y7_9CILI|nr:unnamed protein product [Paramecium pentaurelia]
MGACASQKNPNTDNKPPLVPEPEITDENVKRIKQQFEDLTQLLESMSQEFKTITDNIIKLQQSQQQQIEN